MEQGEKEFELYLLFFIQFGFITSTYLQKDGLIDCACKIEREKLHAVRFTLTWKNISAQSQITAALDFFNTVAARVEVKLNYQQLEKFFSNNFNYSKVTRILVGVDARTEVTDSHLKLFIGIDNYLEKVKSAINLCRDSPDLRSVLIKNNLLIGFDFSLNGRNAIEVYPTLNSEEFRQADVLSRLTKILPTRAIELLNICDTIKIGFSKANESKILYFHPIDHNYFVDNLGNQLANRVHAYYRHQAVRDLVVCIPETELLGGAIHKLNMYYALP